MHEVRSARAVGPCDTMRREEGFQTAEAIGIAAVGLLVLFGIWGAMGALGVDVIEWIRSTFGIGGAPGLL